MELGIKVSPLPFTGHKSKIQLDQVVPDEKNTVNTIIRVFREGILG